MIPWLYMSWTRLFATVLVLQSWQKIYPHFWRCVLKGYWRFGDTLIFFAALCTELIFPFILPWKICVAGPRVSGFFSCSSGPATQICWVKNFHSWTFTLVFVLSTWNDICCEICCYNQLGTPWSIHYGKMQQVWVTLCGLFQLIAIFHIHIIYFRVLSTYVSASELIA